MGDFREIITKAVVAKGRKFTKSHHTITPEKEPSNILGCWIINHQFAAKKLGDTVAVNGTFDVNVWYACNDNTKTDVVSKRIDYKDMIQVKYRDDNYLDDQQIIATPLQQPNCLEASLSSNGKTINVHVEKELFVEIIGETKLRVAVNNHAHVDEWDVSVDDDEFANINTDFLIESEEA